MKILKNKNYTLIKPDIDSESELLKNIQNDYKSFENENIIIDFSEKINIDSQKIFVFLELNEKRKKSGSSFVIIINQIDIDELPEDICVVPSLEEAIDIIEMELIERELGI